MGFDTCHRPFFLFCYSYDALYTPIGGGFDVCIALYDNSMSCGRLLGKEWKII